MEPALRFALLIGFLHSATLLVVWGATSGLLRRGAFPRFQVANGKAPDAALVARARRDVLPGQLLLPAACYFIVYPLWIRAGGSMAGWHSPLQLCLHILAFILIEDTVFYFAHRALHTRWLFRHVHAQHHRFRYVRGLSAEYAHPLESLANFIAFFLGPILLGSPFAIVVVWIPLRMLETVEAHSGYAFTASSSRHAFHHLHAQRGCYGSFFAPWDRLLGTDRQWRAQRDAQRAPSTDQKHA
jgi:4-alpha-methyl-delta7-sterol-4alpha-methyl oxidase